MLSQPVFQSYVKQLKDFIEEECDQIMKGGKNTVLVEWWDVG